MRDELHREWEEIFGVGGPQPRRVPTKCCRAHDGDGEAGPRGSLVGRGGHASGVCAGSRSGRLSKRPCHGRRRKRDGRRWARKHHREPASLFRGVHRSSAVASDTFLPGGRRRCRDVASKKQMGRATHCRRWASSCCRLHAARSASQLLRFGGTSTYLGCVWAPLLRSSRRQFLGAKLPLAP